jgi:23S rRNA (uracil1939-C5)-methyltransferase
MALDLPQVSDLIEGKIEKLAFGGEGILRYRGFVIFVPFTCPEDVVTCRIVEMKKSFGKGELVSIQKSSPYRISPSCPYFGTCGGCQLQHLNDQEQLIYKKNSVVDALKRIGHLNVPHPTIVPAHLKWAYRRHITLHLRPHHGYFQAGYIGIDNQSLIQIKTCPIFIKKENSIIDQIQSVVQKLPNPDQYKGKVTILKNQRDQYILSFEFDPGFAVQEHFFKDILQKHPIFAGILLRHSREVKMIGDCYSEQKLEELTFRFTPQSFIQNHPEQSANIYKQVCALVSHQHINILDLYCGFGMTSLLLAHQGHSVTGIEYNPEAIQFAQDNKRLNHLQARFLQGDVEKILPKLQKEKKPDLILMNPPRSGLNKKIIDHLLNIQPAQMIYISCMPSTLARDLAQLCAKKYDISQCLIYDMFPQTAHVETLIHLQLKTQLAS